jgi:chitin disaccharide deacetylase
VKLIINADDFGCSSVVNDAITRAFKMRLIDRATAIANGQFFAEACQLAHSNGFEDRIGIHFNITNGQPINFQMAQTPLFCSNSGGFIYQRNNKKFLSKSEMSAVLVECEDQIRRFHQQGLYPTHFDSHQHVHTEWFIFRAIESVLRKYGFLSVRISQNIGEFSFKKRVYKEFFNYYLKRRKWNCEDFSGDYFNLIRLKTFSKMTDAVVEAMVHPTLNSRGVVIDALSGEELAPQIKNLRGLGQSYGQTC